MDKLMKLIEKKKKEGKEMDPLHKQAKMDMLKSLRGEMSGMMKDDLMPGKAKVEVAADSPEGLSEGLDKAKDLLKSKMEESQMDEEEKEDKMMPSDGEMVEESMEHEMAEGEMSDEEMAQLEKLLAKAKAKKMMA